MMKSKIHRVTVTEANLNYIGSITIDRALLRAANILEGERVWIVDNNNGERFDTYTIGGEEGSDIRSSVEEKSLKIPDFLKSK